MRISPWRVRRRDTITTCALLFVLSLGVSARGQYGFPLTVDNSTDVTRVNAPVVASVAIPYDIPLTSTNILMLVDDANVPVPVQFKVLSRWWGPRTDGSKVIKWMTCMFNATVNANSSRTYFVRVGSGTNGGIVTQNTSADVRVNTGGALFVIDKTQFSLFKQVFVGSTSVTGGAGALEVHDSNGNLAGVTLTSTTVEEPGSVRVVVKQKGKITGLGLDFTVRYYFFNGRSDVRVDFRLENPGNYGVVPYMGSPVQTAYFDDLSLVVKLNSTANGVATTTLDRSIPTNGAYSLNQTFTSPTVATDMWTGFSFTEQMGLSQLGTGNRYDGAIALNGPSGGISVAIDRFWQNFPKAFRTSGNKLIVDLFPAFGSGPYYSGQYGTFTSGTVDPMSLSNYRFEGGRWKTHTLVFDFRTASGFSPSEVAAKAKEANSPMLGRMPADWAFSAFAFGAMVVERRANAPTSNQRFERLQDVLADDNAADNQNTLGKIGLPKFIRRGGTYGGDQMYGWHTFGDVFWGDGYSSLHYDLPYGVLINWFRTGKYHFYDVGRDLIAHRRDYDQNHTTNTSSTSRGGQSYEKGFFHGNYSSPLPSHIWVHGLLVHYVMTGDEGSREAALEAGDYIVRQHPETWNGFWGSRILGWQLEALVHLWNYVGESNYITLAQQVANNWKNLEVANGSHGYVPNPGWSSSSYPVHEQTWMHCIVYGALAKYYLATFDQSIKPCLQRMTDWIVDDVVEQMPQGPMTARTIGEVWGRATDTYRSEPSVHHLWVTIDALSYGAIIFEDQTYMDTARDLWECVTRYHQVQPGTTTTKNYNDSNTFSAVAFRMMNFPNSETKIMSNIALWGQSYPMARLLWDGQF